jgi:hypothetical protein
VSQLRRPTRTALTGTDGSSTNGSTEIVIPDPAPDAIQHLRTTQVLARLNETDDIGEAEEYRVRAQALVDYLARKADPGPAHVIANLAAVRIGELLGPAEPGGGGRKVSGAAETLDKSARSDFRLMAQYRHVVEEHASVSRAQVIQAIKEVRQDEQSLAALPQDLADKVRSEDMTLREAERVAVDRERRLDAWVLNIQEGLRTLGRMANYDIPDEIANRMGAKELDLLKKILDTLAGGDYGFLG